MAERRQIELGDFHDPANQRILIPEWGTLRDKAMKNIFYWGIPDGYK
jgi:hypothetical protein